MTDNYDDIINLPHPEPANHRRMTMMARAAQFAPFAALTGHDAAIAETARYTDLQIEPGEAITDELNRTFALLRERIHEHPTVKVTHFVPDERKQGGHYATSTLQIKRMDLDNNQLISIDGTAIEIASIIALAITD